VTDAVRAATDVVAKRLGKLKPRAAIVLGSGLAGVADAVRDAVRIPYKDIPGFPEPGAPGHKGELVGGTLEGVPVVVQSGRFHLYEGHAPEVAALPTRVFARLGATREGELRNERVLADGHLRTSVVFGITKEEWPSVRERLLGYLAR